VNIEYSNQKLTHMLTGSASWADSLPADWSFHRGAQYHMCPEGRERERESI